VLSGPDLLGRFLDTFVAAQLRPEVDLLQRRAGTAPTRKDARHLLWLRDELGDNRVRGVVFHTGTQPFELDDRIWALPIATLWA
jgi:hypothetical protein